MELVPEEQYVTKVLAASATGQAPDFGWGTAGKGAQLARDGVIVPLDELIAEAGLDLATSRSARSMPPAIRNTTTRSS